MTNGITKMADGSDVPIGSVVHTLNGAFMKLSSGSVAVTPTAVVSQNGTVTTGYISKADNLTYMLGGTRPEVGSAVVTANGNYTMTTSGGSKLPTTVTETLSKGFSGDAVVALQVEQNVKTNAGLALDDKFGSQTQAAVIAYQASNGLVQDGRVGPQTSAALGFGYVAPVTKTTNAIISSPSATTNQQVITPSANIANNQPKQVSTTINPTGTISYGDTEQRLNAVSGYNPQISTANNKQDTIALGPGYFDPNPFSPSVGLGKADTHLIGPFYVETRALSASISPDFRSGLGAEASLATVGIYIIIPGKINSMQTGIEVNFVGAGIHLGGKTGLTLVVGGNAYVLPVENTNR